MPRGGTYIGAHENQMGLPAQAVQQDGADHGDDEVPQPVIGGTDSTHGHTKTGGGNFCAVQEVRAKESDGDEEVEQENEEGRGNLSRSVALGEAASNCKRQHATCHTGTTEHEKLAASESVDGEECDEAGEEFPGQSATAENAGGLAVHTKALLEDDLR